MCSIFLCCGDDWNANYTTTQEDFEKQQLSEQLKKQQYNYEKILVQHYTLEEKNWNKLTPSISRQSD